MMSHELGGRVAAFFDLDGTLIARPSLERQFFSELRRRRAIPMTNYFLSLAQAVRLAPRGIQMMQHANKMYSRGVSVRDFREGLVAPRFFPEAIDQVAWHAKQGHPIVLVSGTLAPLAQEMAVAVVVRLAVRGIAASVAVCATRLEETDGRWTGRILGDAMFGKAKGRAMRQLAAEKGFDLAQCYAYGDGADDLWMLDTVGRPVAVNPSRRLKRLAGRRGWPVFAWAAGKKRRQSSSSTQSEQRNAEEICEHVR
jgi:HAD superfamily hydrolase (TIGR01490 family)